MPAISFEYSMADCNKFNWANCEILGTEPLHDISRYIKNLFHEIVEHIPNKTYLQNVITSSYKTKEVKRGGDTRLALLLVTNSIKDNTKSYIQDFRDIICNSGVLLYINGNKRTAESALALNGIILGNLLSYWS